MKNNIKKILLLIIIIILAIISSFFLKNSLNEKANNINSDFQDNLPILSTDIELEEAYVTKVVDGDTLWVKINNEEKKIRFIGIDCPEYTKQIEPYGKEATEYTSEKLLNKTIYLQKDVTDVDNYDRLLRYVWTEKVDKITDENISKYLFNYSLVNEGLAESRYYKPNVKFQDYLNEAQNEAKYNNRGMWQ